MDMWCPGCGMRFRSMEAEAKHRHNYPLLCRKTKPRRGKERVAVPKPASAVPVRTVLKAVGQ